MALPPAPELELLHTRTYDVKAYRKSETMLLLRGTVRDEKPAGLYVVDDPEPLTIHHMVVDIDVIFPQMEIAAVRVVFEDFPHAACPSVVPQYEKLIGISITRGFTNKVRELFGGPRGCTHVLALLQAMAPVTNQTRFSMMAASLRSAATKVTSVPFGDMANVSTEQRMAAMKFNLNTCHVWDEDGEHVTAMKNGGPVDIPVWITKRYNKLGRDITNWRAFSS